MVTARVITLLATLVGLCADLCLARYSLYISEENLQSYYSNSAYADVIQGQFVPIVDDGEILVSDNGALLLSAVPSGPGGSGSGYNLAPGHNVGSRSLDSVFDSSMQLPPLPAHVDTVNFTWVATATVNYTLRVTQEGGQFLNPHFNVHPNGLIPHNQSSLLMRLLCRPLAIETGRAHVNLTTIANQSETFVSFFLEKSCNETSDIPSISTVLQPSITQEDYMSSQSLLLSLSVLFTSSSQFPLLSPTPTLHPHPLAPTPVLSTPVLSSSLLSSHLTPSLSHTPPLASLTDLPSTHLFSSLSMDSTALPYPYPSPSSISSSPSSFSSTFHPSPLSFMTTLQISSISQSSPLLYSSTVLSSSHTLMSRSLSQSLVKAPPSELVGSSSTRTRQPTTAEVSSSVLLAIPGQTDSSSELLILVCAPIGGVLLACIVISLCLVLCLKLKTSRKKTMQVFSDDPLDVVQTVPYSPSAMHDYTKKTPPPPLSLWMSLPWGYVGSLPRSLQTLVTQLGVDRKSLSIIDTISRGEYGSVVSGQLNNVRTDVMSGSQSVTIKMLSGLPEGSRRDEVVRFLEAATLMKGIKHRNIVPVLRVSVEDNYVPLVIYPMVEYYDMYRVIKLASDPEHSVLPPLTTILTLDLAIQIATAMNYLAEHSIVHPDLALRNCVLDSACIVKVSDGALAQQFHPECYYTLFGATRPVRWAAVETLQEGLCTARSNVWSYAVTVWEILTFAEMPYSEVNNNRSILSTIKMGARLPRPNNCPEELYKLLCTCWNERGEERPNFKQLISCLKRLLSQLSNRHENNNGKTQSSHTKTRYSSSSIGKSVSRDQLSHGGDSPRLRNHLSPREAAMGSSKRVSMASMISRESAAEKLSVTFSVLSGMDDNMPSGSDSEDEANQGGGLELKTFTERRELQSMLRQVSTSFVDSPVEKGPPIETMKDEANSSIHTTSDISSHTLVPPSRESPLRSPRRTAGDETSLASSNPVSLTPPPTQCVETQSKTSTVDLESVSTAPYTSSPLHSTTFLYPSTPGSGYYGAVSSSERGDQSPLVVGHRARTSHSPALLPSQPSAKSTDSGIRSDEDSETTQFPNTSMRYTPKANSPNVVDREDQGITDFSSSLLAAFDTWDRT